MKRIQAACLEQTIHFQLKDGLPREDAKQRVREEYGAYKTQMDRNGTKYRILEEVEQPDGSIVIQIKRQYNTSPVGHYFD